ncbi:hypothetical protein PILCRDRAFT_825576 [Piloderma croceum F 1598]|uniref:Uncharacterized protein n=1 Tax=Piloderma croceum (strain F 1598) TaxID=765440 RepID=A0A0C3FBW7_PILCF|nr:hypothetical protein PILCRDRAFT_825576 [Piloderma croceum F 1598]
MEMQVDGRLVTCLSDCSLLLWECDFGPAADNPTSLSNSRRTRSQHVATYIGNLSTCFSYTYITAAPVWLSPSESEDIKMS